PTDQNVVRRRHRTMTLVGSEMGELRAEFAPPDDGVTAIARMAKRNCAGHFRYLSAHKISIPAKTTAGEDQRVASDPLARAIGSCNFHTRDLPFGVGQKSFGNASAQNDNVIEFGRGAQTVDQFATGTARQARHPQPREPWIVEVVDHIERQTVTVCQPFDKSRGILSDGINDSRIDLAVSLVRDVRGKQFRVVMNALGTLKSGSRGGN